MSDPVDTKTGPLVALRSVIGGTLMGLANLVPGISGGTMLLAAGIYPRFVNAIAILSTLKLRRDAVLVLALVVSSAVLAVLLFAGPVKDLVVEHRWIMYSLFIGLTLGGIPVVWRMVKPATTATWIGAGAGFIAMAALALMQQSGVDQAGAGTSNALTFGLAGVAGASAMILPGVSGGYLLLVMGQYIPILSAIDSFKVALEARDIAAAMTPALSVMLPVGIGVVVGVVLVSNAIRWLLAHHGKATLGVLLGLLVGAVVGLWPFQATVEPVFGETIIKGQVVTAENVGEFNAEDYPTAFFRPAPAQVAGAIGLILAGTAITMLIARLGGDER